MTTVAARQRQLLIADARNRALRTFLQGLGIDVLVASAVVVAQVAASPLESWQGWAAVGISLSRSVAQAAASYVMRRFLDRSRIPTPLPPDAPGEPDAKQTVARKGKR
ncbi:MAG: hypothetical protein JWP14_3363 [Frankiales bacterium]|nr:hypothetical protein [Frankiales bacterium]